MIQPVLVPCHHSADLFLTVNPGNPGMADVYWGTALLQRVPCDPRHPLLRLTAGLLYNLRFPARKLAECLPLCSKTIRSIGLALRERDPRELMGVILGPSEREALSDDQKQYVRAQYLELGPECRDFRETIRRELKRIWEVDVCGEVLRRCFREVDAEQAGKDTDHREHPEPMMTAGGTPAPQPLSDPIPESTTGKSGCASEEAVSTVTRNAVSLSCPEASPTDTTTETAQKPARNDVADEPPALVAASPWPIPFPRIPDRPQWCAHAGLFVLLPWLEEGFGDAPPEIQQLAMQVLAGAVNHENSRYTSFDSLKLLCEPVYRSIRSQRAWCKQHASDGTLEGVLLGNARLARLDKERVFYFDPHTEKYTGLLKILLGWSGNLHGTVKALHLDFIHTSEGYPCHIGHFDNYDDMRPRFLVSRDRFKELLGISDPVTWVVDRGIWSKKFLAELDALGDRFVTWEKGYNAKEESRWELPCSDRGRFSRRRRRNNHRDTVRYRFEWREQAWEHLPNGRRFIVRARKPKGGTVEVSIVSNNLDMPAEKLIWLMFNRWLQENDFAYLLRHFGIGELTERGFDTYAEIAPELQDRQVKSRAYKRTDAQRKEQQKELAEMLLEQRTHGTAQDMDGLRKERDKLRARLPKLETELQRLRDDQSNDVLSPLDRLTQTVSDIATRLLGNRKAQSHAREAAEIEANIRETEQTIEQIEARLKEIPKKESRIQALIEQQYVRLRMRSKPVADAVRITCRNVFCRPLKIFRPIFDNLRTDHAVLRSVTRAPGLISATPEQIDVHLLPSITIEPAERDRIRRFLDICEHRCAATAALQDGPKVRFKLLLRDAEINSFFRRLGPN